MSKLKTPLLLKIVTDSYYNLLIVKLVTATPVFIQTVGIIQRPLSNKLIQLLHVGLTNNLET